MGFYILDTVQPPTSPTAGSSSGLSGKVGSRRSSRGAPAVKLDAAAAAVAAASPPSGSKKARRIATPAQDAGLADQATQLQNAFSAPAVLTPFPLQPIAVGQLQTQDQLLLSPARLPQAIQQQHKPTMQTYHVQCDACDRWRKLPLDIKVCAAVLVVALMLCGCQSTYSFEGSQNDSHKLPAFLHPSCRQHSELRPRSYSLTQINESAPWFCEMHPDPAFRSCSVPEEDESASGAQGSGCARQQSNASVFVMGQVRLCCKLYARIF